MNPSAQPHMQAGECSQIWLCCLNSTYSAACWRGRLPSVAWGNASAPARAVKSNPLLSCIPTAARPSTAASKLPTPCRGNRTMLAFTKGMCSSILVLHPRTSGKCWPASLQKQAEGKSQGRPFHQRWALTQMKGVAIRFLKCNSSVVKAATLTILETLHIAHLLYYLRFH